jgi:hypothetical protein
MDKAIKKMVFDETQGLYTINFSTNSSQILLGKMVLDEVMIRPNFKKMDSLVKMGNPPCRIYLVKIKNIEIYFFSGLLEAFWKNHWKIDLIKMAEPQFSIILSSHPCTSTQTPLKPSSPSHKLGIGNIEIKKFQILSAKIEVLTPSLKERPYAFKSSNIMLDADNVRWNDREKNHSLLEILKGISFSVVMKEAHWISPQGNYQIVSQRVFYTHREGIMEMENCQGKASRDSTANKFPLEPPKGLHFDLKYVLFRGFNWPSLLLGESFEVDSVHIQSGNIGVIDEHQAPHGHIYKPLPQEWLEKISMPLSIKIMEFKDLSMAYEERNQETGKSGNLNFFHSSGIIQNIHNRSFTKIREDSVLIRFTSSFYGKGNLVVNLGFNLQSPDLDFKVHAHMTQFPLIEINSMTLPLAGIKVSGGNLNSLNFTMQGNRWKTQGKVNALYRNLRLKFLVQSRIKDPKKIKTMSSLANTFLILNDNPILGEKERVSEFQFTRDPSRSFFNYVWKSLFTGLKPILGITTDREKSIYSFIQQLQNYEKWDRELKPERRQHRKIRREKRILRQLEKGLNSGFISPV